MISIRSGGGKERGSRRRNSAAGPPPPTRWNRTTAALTAHGFEARAQHQPRFRSAFSGGRNLGGRLPRSQGTRPRDAPLSATLDGKTLAAPPNHLTPPCTSPKRAGAGGGTSGAAPLAVGKERGDARRRIPALGPERTSLPLERETGRPGGSAPAPETSFQHQHPPGHHRQTGRGPWTGLARERLFRRCNGDHCRGVFAFACLEGREEAPA